MDPIGSIHLPSDSTFVVALEAFARGHELYSYQPDTLSWQEGLLLARGRRILAVRREPGNHVDEGARETLDLATFDVVLIRQDPPFDMDYVTNTHLLELLPADTLVINDPKGIRDSPEKLLILRFAALTPPTLITCHADDVLAFQAEFGPTVVKPLYGHGGDGVFLLPETDPHLKSTLERLEEAGPFMVQQYIPSVTEDGDRRIILVDGRPVGAIDRIPKPGDIRSNLVAGGTARPAVLSDRDREICSAIGPELRRRGLLLAGIDVIGGYLTEINVTSPTGLPAIERFDGTNIGAQFWDAVAAHQAARKA